jgi:hypothetical protein
MFDMGRKGLIDEIIEGVDDVINEGMDFADELVRERIDAYDDAIRSVFSNDKDSEKKD